MINFKVELIKLLSCMDAVFTPLHVEVARKATDGSEKKNGADTEMGYCPFEHKSWRAVQSRWVRAEGRWARRLGRWALGPGARGMARTHKRAGQDAGRAGARGAPRAQGHTRRKGARRCDTSAWRCDMAGWAATTKPLCALGRACARLGVLLGQQAVHLVHPACFWTQYCF